MYCLYIDGSGNNEKKSPAAYAGILYKLTNSGKIELKKYKKYIGYETQHEAKYQGILEGLKYAMLLNITQLNIYGNLEDFNGNFLKTFVPESKETRVDSVFPPKLISNIKFHNISNEDKYYKKVKGLVVDVIKEELYTYTYGMDDTSNFL